MQKSRASFTVFFEDPFWVGVYEREEPGGLTACRVVFGAEPKDGEIYEWMLQNWAQLALWPPAGGCPEAPGGKPEACPAHGPALPCRTRRGNEGAAGAGTGARCRQTGRAAARREQEQADRERRFALRVQRRKEKHRGR